jgi:hypothetical protein
MSETNMSQQAISIYNSDQIVKKTTGARISVFTVVVPGWEFTESYKILKLYLHLQHKTLNSS